MSEATDAANIPPDTTPPTVPPEVTSAAVPPLDSQINQVASGDGVTMPLAAVIADVDKYCTPQDSALLYAWQLQVAYGKASSDQKKSYINLRMAVILLGWFASFLAVATALPILSTLFDADTTGTSKNVVRLIVVILPITTAAVLNYATQFAVNFTWIVYRLGAENIRREIYLYRASAGEYAKPDFTTVQKQHLLVDKVGKAREDVDKQLFELLSQNTKDSDQANIVSPAYPLLEDVFSEERPEVVRQKLGIRTDDKDDDGFSAITSGNDYLKWRVIRQRDWYVNRIRDDYRKLRRNRVIVLVVAGLGSLFAALGTDWERFVVITTSGSVAISAYIQLNMFGRTYTNYRITAERLNYHIAAWNILSSKEQADHTQVANLVQQVEDTFHVEHQNWRDVSIQVQTEGEQTLMRDYGERKGK